MSTCKCYVIANQGVNDFAFGVSCTNTMNPMQQKRVMRDDQIESAHDCLIDDHLHWINGKHHAFNGRTRISTDQTHGIPVSG